MMEEADRIIENILNGSTPHHVLIEMKEQVLGFIQNANDALRYIEESGENNWNHDVYLEASRRLGMVDGILSKQDWDKMLEKHRHEARADLVNSIHTSIITPYTKILEAIGTQI